MAPGAHWHTASISCRGSVAPSFRRTCVAGSGAVARRALARPSLRPAARSRGPGTREPRARVERVPVVELLLHRVRRRVVVQVHEPREVVVADLGNEDAVREVARDVPLRSRERDLVDPRVQPLELRVVHGGHGRVSLRVPSATEGFGRQRGPTSRPLGLGPLRASRRANARAARAPAPLIHGRHARPRPRVAGEPPTARVAVARHRLQRPRPSGGAS